MRSGLPALGGGESSGQIRMSTHLYSKRKVCNLIFLGYKLIIRGSGVMVTTETITIEVPVGMSKYLEVINPELEFTRNALLLYPYILNQTISHGRAAEILGIRKSELIDLYDKLGYSYFDIIQDDLDDELNTFRELKKKDYNFNT